jgi:hypothetical protein
MSEPGKNSEEAPENGPNLVLDAPSIPRTLRNGWESTNPTSSAQPENPSQGPSLTLLYSLLVLALAVAIGLALLIVLPFYHRQ